MNDGYRSAVTLTAPLFNNPDIAALPVQVPVLHFIEKTVYNRFLIDIGKGLASRVEIAPLGQGDQFFGNRPERLRLCIGRLYLFMLKQGRRQIDP